MPPKVISEAKHKKRTQKAKANKSVKLFEELDFISVVFESKGNPSQQHACFNNGRLTASNGIISAGIKTDVDINARPHIMQLLEAIRNCPAEFAMTQIDEGRICVKADKFTANVNCLPEELAGYAPDSPCAAISDGLKTGFDIIAPFAVEGAKKIILGAVLLRKGSMISTDSIVILEAWHGLDLPELLLPKSFISAVMDCKKSVSKLGFSDNSVTFFHEDESWFKSALHNETYPNVDAILNVQSNPVELPEGFYKALLAIEPFSKGSVYFGDGCLQSHRDKNEGAVYEVPGVQFGPCFNIKQLRRIESCITTIDFYSYNYAIFYGKVNGANVRGAIMGVRA